MSSVFNLKQLILFSSILVFFFNHFIVIILKGKINFRNIITTFNIIYKLLNINILLIFTSRCSLLGPVNCVLIQLLRTFRNNSKVFILLYILLRNSSVIYFIYIHRCNIIITFLSDNFLFKNFFIYAFYCNRLCFIKTLGTQWDVYVFIIRTIYAFIQILLQWHILIWNFLLEKWLL